MRPGLSHRAAGLALVALFVLGQGALFAHQLLVPHQACAEHGGELIHVVAERPAPVFDSPSWLLAQPVSAPHGHDHCIAFSTRRHDAAPVIAPPAAGERFQSTQTPPPEQLAAIVSRDLRLRLAPKSSPPV
jgi:hypothetical protein